jgi:outer membrane protein
MTENMMKLASAIALLLSVGIGAAQAQESPQWILRAGVHPIQPKPHNHAQLDVGSAAAITFAATYMATGHWGMEVFAALPASHDVTLRDTGKVAELKQLPSTVSLQYHFFDPNGRIRAYVGVGLNYTTFIDESTTGVLAGADLKLDPSLGPAAQVGLDFDLGRAWFVSFDARWFDIDAPAHLNGARIGTLEIDPYAVGMSLGRRLQ